MPPSADSVVLVAPLLLAEAVAATLAGLPMTVIGVAADSEAHEIAARVRMQHISGANVIVAGVDCSDDEVVDLIEAGASTSIGSDAPVRELYALLQAAQRGEPVFSARDAALVGRRLAQLARHWQEPIPVLLSPRERDVLELLGLGRSNKEIAASLDVRPSTVKAHLRGLYRKLGVHTRRQAVVRALRSR